MEATISLYRRTATASVLLASPASLASATSRPASWRSAPARVSPNPMSASSLSILPDHLPLLCLRAPVFLVGAVLAARQLHKLYLRDPAAERVGRVVRLDVVLTVADNLYRVDGVVH